MKIRLPRYPSSSNIFILLLPMLKIIILIFLPLSLFAESMFSAIGIITPLSGNRSSIGEDARRGAELAREELEAEGINNLSLIFEDSQGDPKQGVAAYQKLIKQNVKIIITQNSNVSIPILPLGQRDQILQMAISTTSDRYSTANDFSYRMNGSTKEEAIVMADFLTKTEGDISILTMQDEYPVGLQKHLLEELRKRAIKPKKLAEFLPAETDFRSQIVKIKDSKQIVCLGYQVPCALLFKQLREINCKARLIGNVPLKNNEFFTSAGIYSEGIFIVYPEPNLMHPAAIAYQEKYNTSVNLFSANAYDAIKLLGYAISKCKNSLASCISQQLNDQKKYSGLSGDKKIDPLTGDMNDTYSILVSRSGKFVSF